MGPRRKGRRGEPSMSTKKTTQDKKSKTSKKISIKKKDPQKVSQRRKKPPPQTHTLKEACDDFLFWMEKLGKSEGTIFSYRLDLKVAQKALGADTDIATLTPDVIKTYFESDAVTKTRSGKPKAKPTIDKTRRVLRLTLEHVVGQRWLTEAPIPEEYQRKSRKGKKA